MIRKYNRKVSLVILAGILSLTGGSVFLLPLNKFDYRFEEFFPAGDSELAFYKDFTRRFETDNDFLLIGLGSGKGVFDSVFLHKVAALTYKLRKLKHVEYVVSPTTEKRVVLGPLGPIGIPYIHLDDPAAYPKDSARIFHSGYMVGSLIATNARAVALFVKTGASMPKELNDSLLFSVEDAVANFSFDATHIAGKIKGQYYFIQRMQTELAMFIITSILLLVLFLFIAFKSLRGILIPAAVVFIAVLWTQAVLVLNEKQITLITTLLPTILFVVGVSAVVHILEKLIEEFQKGREKTKALLNTYKIVGKATFLTCLTTAIGFLSLTTSRIVPTIDFGIFTAFGVLCILLLVFTLLPAIVTLDPKFHRIAKRTHRTAWKKLLKALFPIIIRNRVKILLLFFLALIIALVGIQRLRVDNSFLEDYSENDQRMEDYRFFENEFSGFRSFELAVWMKDSVQDGLLSLKTLKQLEKIENYLKEDYGCGFLISPLTFVKSANRAKHGGGEQWYRLPDKGQEMAKLRPAIRKFIATSNRRKYLTPDHSFGRISGKVNDLGGHRFNILNNRLDSFMQASTDTSLIGYKVTGMGTMIDKNNAYITLNMLKGLSLAFAAIALIMALLYRSLRMVVIALAPNTLPLLLVAGLMGFCGIDLKISTSIIFTIAFGIAVDDTIHFLTRLKVELDEGKSLAYALKRSFLSTGKAMIVTTLILCAGFICLLLSEITSTFYIGFLVGTTLFIALLCNIFLLPVLLMLLFKRK
ncbi:MAG: RND family transporter [Flavobacteriales bacterium]